jgi:hypothetical protein
MAEAGFVVDQDDAPPRRQRRLSTAADTVPAASWNVMCGPRAMPRRLDRKRAESSLDHPLPHIGGPCPAPERRSQWAPAES